MLEDNQNQMSTTKDTRKEEIFEVPYKESHSGVAGTSSKKNSGLKSFAWAFSALAVLLMVFFMGTSMASFLNEKGAKNHGLMEILNKKSAKGGASEGPEVIIRDYEEGATALSPEEIYKKVVPSIVGVVTYNNSRGLIGGVAGGQGSGIIISADGYIVTNAHVVTSKGRIQNATVVISEGENKKEYPAKVVGCAVGADIAVLKIDATGLGPVEFGNSDQIAVGAKVFAIGNPGGLEFSNSLTSGILSAKNRSLGDGTGGIKFLQVDAAVNPGNSGGVLSNALGQAIGITTCGLKGGYENMNFAIPSNDVKRIVDEILENKGETTGSARLGVTLREMSGKEAREHGIPLGLVVVEIFPESHAKEAGLQSGDVITKFAGNDSPSFEKLLDLLGKHQPGDAVPVEVCRVSIVQKKAELFTINIPLIEGSQITS